MTTQEAAMSGRAERNAAKTIIAVILVLSFGHAVGYLLNLLGREWVCCFQKAKRERMPRTQTVSSCG
jgi:hypothetical protein